MEIFSPATRAWMLSADAGMLPRKLAEGIRRDVRTGQRLEHRPARPTELVERGARALGAARRQRLPRRRPWRGGEIRSSHGFGIQRSRVNQPTIAARRRRETDSPSEANIPLQSIHSEVRPTPPCGTPVRIETTHCSSDPPIARRSPCESPSALPTRDSARSRSSGKRVLHARQREVRTKRPSLDLEPQRFAGHLDVVMQQLQPRFLLDAHPYDASPPKVRKGADSAERSSASSRCCPATAGDRGGRAPRAGLRSTSPRNLSVRCSRDVVDP